MSSMRLRPDQVEALKRFERPADVIHCAVRRWRAKKIHPDYPRNVVLRAAIMAEEAGEVIKAANDYHTGKGSIDDVKTELKQTAAMCLRMIEAMEDGK